MLTKKVPIFPGINFGGVQMVPPIFEIRVVLNKKERAALRRAAEIAEEVRERIRKVDPEVDSAPADDRNGRVDVEVAMAEHGCRQLADDGWVPVERHR